MRAPRAVVVGIVLAFGVTGCGDDQSSPATGSSQPASDPPASMYGDNDPETLLAVIDANGDRPPDSEIDGYARMLDRLDRFCREPRNRLADHVVNGVQILKDEKGLDYTNAELLRSYRNAITPKLGRQQKCADLLVGVLAITTAEESP